MQVFDCGSLVSLVDWNSPAFPIQGCWEVEDETLIDLLKEYLSLTSRDLDAPGGRRRAAKLKDKAVARADAIGLHTLANRLFAPFGFKLVESTNEQTQPIAIEPATVQICPRCGQYHDPLDYDARLWCAITEPNV